MAQRRPVPMGALVGAMVVGAAVAGGIFWRLNLTAIDGQITTKTSALKKLVLSGRIPPNEEVMEYLTSRQDSLERRYQRWLQRVASVQVAEASSADPQLYFQEQFHEVQRTLERLATARAMAVPEQLGFPKELPPSDTVSRLLIQLSLIKEAAALIFEQGVAGLSSFKIEDPQTVPEPEGEEPFLIRLPVRVRLSASLPQLMKVLGAIQRANPLIDVLAIRIAPATVQAPPPNSLMGGQAAAPDAPPNGTAQATAQAPAPRPSSAGAEHLEVELLLTRYLVTAQTLPPPGDEEEVAAPESRAVKGKSAASSAAKAGTRPPTKEFGGGASKRSAKPTKQTHHDE